MERLITLSLLSCFLVLFLAPSTPAATMSHELRSSLISANRELRQDDEYAALRILWDVRAQVKSSGEESFLKSVERIMVLIQREDYLAARVRLKSLLR